MSTNGIVTVQSKKGEVLLKFVAGCNGFNARNLVRRLRRRWPVGIDEAHEIALDAHFGCEDCLVTMTAKAA